MRSSSASLLSVSALVLTASSAFAHIDLHQPTARYVVNHNDGGSGGKECPCGGHAVDPDRICNVPAADSHDPARSANVTTFEAGSMATIRLEEYIDHSGRFRVAFDDDGADLADFNSHVLMDIPDDGTKRGGAGVIYEFQVKLPDTTCDNCTLQVIQDMNGRTTTPVADPAKDSTYYTCADIKLVAPGTMGMDDGMDDPADTPPPADNGQAGSNGGTMGMNGGTMGMNAGTMGAASGNMGTNLGTVPMTGDNTAAGAPMGAGTGTNSGSPSTGVGSLMPAGMGTSMGNALAPSNGAPIMSGAASSSDDGGGCSLSNLGARTATNPLAALAVVGMFASLAARRRARRQK